MARVSTGRGSVDIGSNQLCTVIGNWPCCRSSTERAGVEVSKDNRVNTPLFFLLPRVGKLPLHRDYGGLSRVGVLRKYARAEEAIRLQIGLATFSGAVQSWHPPLQRRDSALCAWPHCLRALRENLPRNPTKQIGYDTSAW